MSFTSSPTESIRLREYAHKQAKDKDIIAKIETGITACLSQMPAREDDGDVPLHTLWFANQYTKSVIQKHTKDDIWKTVIGLIPKLTEDQTTSASDGKVGATTENAGPSGNTARHPQVKS